MKELDERLIIIIKAFALLSSGLMGQFFVLDLYVLLHIASNIPSTSSARHSTMRPCGDAAVPTQIPRLGRN